jgi:hypothetical protein
MGWLATAIMLYGSFLVGERNKIGFLCQIMGNAMWGVVGLTRGFQLDLVVVSLAFCILYIRNYRKWCRENVRPIRPALPRRRRAA